MFRSELTRPSAFRLGGATCIAAALPKGVCPVAVPTRRSLSI